MPVDTPTPNPLGNNLVTTSGVAVTLGPMTTASTQIELEIKDFTQERHRIAFRVDNDIFDCVPDLPALALIEFADLAEKVGEDAGGAGQARDMFTQMFNLVLTTESAARFLARMADKDNPIGIRQINDILPWTMEQYGMRPTEPSSASSDGSPTLDGGLNSTGSAPAAALISVPFPASGS